MEMPPPEVCRPVTKSAKTEIRFTSWVFGSGNYSKLICGVLYRSSLSTLVSAGFFRVFKREFMRICEMAPDWAVFCMISWMLPG